MKTRILIALIAVTAFMAILLYMVSEKKIGYQEDFNVIKKSEKMFKAAGVLVKDSLYKYNHKNRILSFYMKDKHGNILKVIYKNSIPNNFENSTGLVVTGKYKGNYFEGKEILTKCPSKYQTQ